MSSNLPPVVQAVSGALASTTANAISYPFDLVATKVQTSRLKRRGSLDVAIHILKRIVEQRGYLGLYDGLETDSGATLLSSFFYFYAYSLLRKVRAGIKGRPLPLVVEELLMGYLAGIASRLISMPLSLITVRLQDDKDSSELDNVENGKKSQSTDALGIPARNRVIKVAKELYNEGGIAGFWRGFSLTFLTSANPALTWAFTALFLRSLRRSQADRQPSSLQNFFSGAMSNALAVSCIYPIILAKTRVSASAKHMTLRKVISDAMENNGVAGLYQGLLVQVIKGFINQGVTLLMKQRIEIQFIHLYRIMRERGVTDMHTV